LLGLVLDEEVLNRPQVLLLLLVQRRVGGLLVVVLELYPVPPATFSNCSGVSSLSRLLLIGCSGFWFRLCVLDSTVGLSRVTCIQTSLREEPDSLGAARLCYPSPSRALFRLVH
jgi:hypothetical protein